jgi:hypothetical protein
VSVGTAILASVVLILAVYHKGFRKVALIVSSIGAIIAALVYAGILIYPRLKKRPNPEPVQSPVQSPDQNAIQRNIPVWNPLTKKYEIAPCPNDLPIGFSLDGYCVLSGVIVEGFRPGMCIGTVTDKGDCLVAGPSWAVGPATQLCPYGLEMTAEGKCPSLGYIDQETAERKLRDLRKRKR